MSKITITIRGPQGAGKTTLALAIADMLENAGVEWAIDDDCSPGALRRIANPDPRRSTAEMLQKLHDIKVDIVTRMGR